MRIWQGVRRIVSASELAVFAACLAVAVWLLWWENKRPDVGAAATIVGALFGGAVLLLGNWINRANEVARARQVLEERRSALAAMITPELVNVAAGMLQASETINAAVEAVRFGGTTLPGKAFASDMPRIMPLTESLGSELLTLDRPALDALVTLQANLAITRLELERVAGQELGLLRLTSLAGGLAHNLDVLAQCFERIAPSRQVRWMNSEPQVFPVVLRRMAERLSSRPDL